MKVKISGMKANILACTGSGGAGFSLVWIHWVMPYRIGQAPIEKYMRNDGKVVCGLNGRRPNRLMIEVGSGADRSWIQPKNGACRISMVTNSTLYSEKNTGIWITIGRQPASGLAPTFL